MVLSKDSNQRQITNKAGVDLRYYEQEGSFSLRFDSVTVQRTNVLMVVDHSQENGSNRAVRSFVLALNMNKYDVVYILKNRVRPDELRYSLRSIEENLEHGNVWFIGGQPNGIIPDRSISMQQTGILKWEKARSSLIRACENEEISERFWLFNDDFFVLKPMESETPYFGGMLRDHILKVEHRYGDKRTGYTRALRNCEQVLKGADLTTFDYALHLPILVDKKKMLEAIETFPDCPMFRSLYGNYAEIGGVQHEDVKIVGMSNKFSDDADFVSTGDSSFAYGRVGVQIRRRFPEACKYEDKHYCPI